MRFSASRLVSIVVALAPAVALAQGTKPATPVPTRSVPVPVPPVRAVDTVDRIVAVVGSSVITWSDLAAAVNEQRAAGLKLPADAAGQLAVARNVLNDLVDQEILVQKAKDVKVDVGDAEVQSQVDQQLREVRSHFQNDAEYRAELKNAGFGTPEEYRRTLFDQLRRRTIQQRVFTELQKRARPASITEAEVSAAFDKSKDELQRRPATVAFRQIVVPPRPSPAADAAAHAKADSLLAELKKGASFDELAKRESMDPGTKNLGGDLGWNRRGSGLVPEFETVMFALRPGELSPPVRTSFGYHIIRVDRVQPAEVKARHILIAPVIDSNDVHRAELRADSLAAAWRAGASFDSLVVKYHDPAEEKGVLTPFPMDSLPASYKAALATAKVGTVTQPFALRASNGTTKWAVLQVVARTEPGQYSLPEVRENIRAQLAYERQAREILDELRKQTYVSVRL